jgi:hypothetical protein
MDQSDVLEKVEGARVRVAQTIQHAEAGRDKVEEVFRATGEHFSTLNEDFNATLAHFQSEAGRAKDIAQQVIDALLKAGQEAAQAAQDNRQGLSALAHSAGEAMTQNDAGSAALGEHSKQVDARLEATDTLFHAVDEGADQARQHQHEGVDALGVAVGNWHSQTTAKSQEQHNAANTVVQEYAEQHVSEFNQGADHSVETARQSLEQQQHDLEQLNQDQVEHLRNDREQARNEMQNVLQEMGSALDSLRELASTTADTLTHGADEARDLMSMTNIGVKTVIGLVENLQKIFDEIESAWS